MKSSMIEAFGYTAGILSVTSFIPQVYTSVTTVTQRLNIWFVLVFIIGLIFWTIYGALLVLEDLRENPDTNDPKGIAVLVFNAIALILNLIIFGALVRKKISRLGINRHESLL
jgi:uncharacterized protein with PQ loop repeat